MHYDLFEKHEKVLGVQLIIKLRIKRNLCQNSTIEQMMIIAQINYATCEKGRKQAEKCCTTHG